MWPYHYTKLFLVKVISTNLIHVFIIWMNVVNLIILKHLICDVCWPLGCVITLKKPPWKACMMFKNVGIKTFYQIYSGVGGLCSWPSSIIHSVQSSFSTALSRPLMKSIIHLLLIFFFGSNRLFFIYFVLQDISAIPQTYPNVLFQHPCWKRRGIHSEASCSERGCCRILNRGWERRTWLASENRPFLKYIPVSSVSFLYQSFSSKAQPLLNNICRCPRTMSTICPCFVHQMG